MKKIILEFLSYLSSLSSKNIADKNKKSLMLFSQNYFLGDSLNENEAKNNLELGLVEIIYPNGDHCANGLLITKNGFLIINEHCLDVVMDCKIRTHNGKIYTPKNILQKNKDKDIALVKIDMDGPEEPMVYKFFNHFSFPKHAINIFHISKWNGKIKYMAGQSNGLMKDVEILHEKKTYKTMLHYTSTTHQGDSGGVVVTENGELIGIHSSSDYQGMFKNCSCCILFDILEVISSYCYKN